MIDDDCFWTMSSIPQSEKSVPDSTATPWEPNGPRVEKQWMNIDLKSIISYCRGSMWLFAKVSPLTSRRFCVGQPQKIHSPNCSIDYQRYQSSCNTCLLVKLTDPARTTTGRTVPAACCLCPCEASHIWGEEGLWATWWKHGFYVFKKFKLDITGLKENTRLIITPCDGQILVGTELAERKLSTKMYSWHLEKSDRDADFVHFVEHTCV